MCCNWKNARVLELESEIFSVLWYGTLGRGTWRFYLADSPESSVECAQFVSLLVSRGEQAEEVSRVLDSLPLSFSRWTPLTRWFFEHSGAENRWFQQFLSKKTGEPELNESYVPRASLGKPAPCSTLYFVQRGGTRVARSDLEFTAQTQRKLCLHFIWYYSYIFFHCISAKTVRDIYCENLKKEEKKTLKVAGNGWMCLS